MCFLIDNLIWILTYTTLIQDDSWRGAASYAKWYLENNLWDTISISKKEYLEFGPDYIKEHPFSNPSHSSRPRTKIK
jgi:hypothetical protein